MPERKQTRGLKKELGLFDVYAIATGATLSSGFFLLPGIAAVGAGPALPLSYLIAALFLLPGLMCAAELATAMPRSGGVYFFLDRSMGPLWGTMSGFGTWFALILKTAFALLGVGAYLSIFFPDSPMTPIVAAFAIVFGIINLVGTKKSGSAQVILVIGLLLLLLWFSGTGVLQVKAEFFRGFLSKGASSIISTSALVVVSYMGLTKIASVAEEVKNPVRNLPLGMFLAFGTALVIYLIGTSIMVGVVSAETLEGDLTPVATVAEALVGRWGAILMTVAAILAFSSVANAGILSSSRYPLAMSRDKLLPAIFGKIGKRTQTPHFSIYVTVALVLLLVTVFNPVKIAKLASSFQLLMFAMSCSAVVVMRESRITSYDPGFRAPFYPWLQLVGMVAPLWLITQNGALSIAFTGGLMLLGVIWYWYFARERVDRRGAILHVFERLGTGADSRLEHEMRGHIKEKGLRPEDPFDAVVARSFVIDLTTDVSFDDVVGKAAELFAEHIPMPAEEIKAKFLEGTLVGATPVTHGVALPHFYAAAIHQAELVLVRSQKSISIRQPDQSSGYVIGEPIDREVHAIFFLVSPDNDPGQHLRILAQIATRVDEDDFGHDWAAAADEKELKEVLLRGEYFHLLALKTGTNTEHLIGCSLQEANLPHGILIAVIRRDGKNIVPQGDTVMVEGDYLTIIGNPDDWQQLRKRYEDD